MTGKWVQAGKGVRTIFQNPKVQLLLGLAINMEVLEPRDRTGEIKIAPQNKQLKAEDTELAHIPSSILLDTTLSGNRSSFLHFSHQIVSSVIVNKDEPIHAGSWDLTTAMDSQEFPMVAKVVKILRLEQQTPYGSKSSLSILALPYAVDAMHPRFYMPVLAPTSAKPFHLPLNVIMAPVNVQHACDLMLCGATGEAMVRQERLQSNRRKAIIEHKHGTTKDFWILNTCAFRNSEFTDPYCVAFPLESRSEVVDKALACYNKLKEAENALTKARKSLQGRSQHILVDGIDISGINYTDPGFDCSTPTIAQLRAILTLYGVATPKGKLKSFYILQLTEKLAHERAREAEKGEDADVQGSERVQVPADLEGMVVD
ncbi:hypothetical protein BT69DRAFT_1335847 [Atractiella rhizophila]|nr:hypothetical protein BT69DRAFT_1335847 [Atractiella rhizophila]